MTRGLRVHAGNDERSKLKFPDARKAEFLCKMKEGFCLTRADFKNMIRDFHVEMRNGLCGKKSHLKMIPTYVARPSGKERGKFIALDLGGTNFRILELELKGNGRILPPYVMKFALDKRHITGTGGDLFDFIASCIEAFMKRRRIKLSEERELGFTFSFPVKQTGVASGELMCWTKGFNAKGVVGKDVVAYLRRALIKRGLCNIKVAALANDTVGTLVAESYSDRDCDAGVIIGTGTNACYPEKVSNVGKMHGSHYQGREIIINVEWGNFDKLRMTRYDKLLDGASRNPGEQILEKMVSGLYLGEIARLALADLEKQGILFSASCACFRKKGILKTEHMSLIEGDKAPRFDVTAHILRSLGVERSSPDERNTIYDVCRMVSVRGASIAAAAILAVVLKMDDGFRKKHVIAIDGSVYEKHPIFKHDMEKTFRELLGKRSSRIKMVLTKDGSGKGAAIIAAVAYANQTV